jgi:hypothetical protein
MREMRKLEINLMELEAAFESGLGEAQYYLDLETGEILLITDEIRWYLEDSPERELPDWQQEMLQQARQIEEGYGIRYHQVPEQDSYESYRDMERFIPTVRDQHLQDRLWRAIQGRGAFRYFKDVLYDYPDERERWFAFSDRRVYERMMAWLESKGIEPTNPREPPVVSAVEGAQASEPEVSSLAKTFLEDLTLLVIYLSSSEESAGPGMAVRRAWKGYLFEVLDALDEKGFIDQGRRGAKSLYLTERGIRRAQKLAEEYGAQ